MAIWVSLNNLSCQKCNAQLKKVRGCEKDLIRPFKIGDYEFFRCPLKLITNASVVYLQAYEFYKDGFLPCQGSVFEQSNKIMEAIKFISNEVEKMTKE